MTGILTPKSIATKEHYRIMWNIIYIIYIIYINVLYNILYILYIIYIYYIYILYILYIYNIYYISVIYGILKLQKIACPRSYTLKPEMNPLRPLFPAVSARFERPTCQASQHPHLGDFGVLSHRIHVWYIC